MSHLCKTGLVIGLFFASSATSFATNYHTLFDANITDIIVYDGVGDGYSIKINIDGLSRPGPNPDNPNVNCELWTNSVGLKTALISAHLANRKVDLRYKARGDDDAFCLVYSVNIKK